MLSVGVGIEKVTAGAGEGVVLCARLKTAFNASSYVFPAADILRPSTVIIA